MDLVDQLVGAEVLAGLGAALDDGQVARLDERGHRRRPVGDEVVVHRVGLEHDHLALDEELGEHVSWAERRHVAGAEDQRESLPGLRVLVGRRLGRLELGPGHAWFDPDLTGGLGEEHLVEGVDREHLNDQPTIGHLTHRPRELWSTGGGDLGDRVLEGPGHADERAEPAEELLAALTRGRVEALGRAGCVEPGGSRRHGVGDDLVEQGDPLGGGRGCPRIDGARHAGDGSVELLDGVPVSVGPGTRGRGGPSAGHRHGAPPSTRRIVGACPKATVRPLDDVRARGWPHEHHLWRRPPPERARTEHR